MRPIRTKSGYALLEVSSAMQKAIRRGDARHAGYWAIELFESNFAGYIWRRLLTISAEDCWGLITHEIEALHRAWLAIDKQKKGAGRIFVAKAVIVLCLCRKSRDADHLTNLVYDAHHVSDEDLLAQLEDARREPLDLPDYTFDCHTLAGKRAGKTKADFLRQEHKALAPREDGLFDADVESLK